MTIATSVVSAVLALAWVSGSSMVEFMNRAIRRVPAFIGSDRHQQHVLCGFGLGEIKSS